MAASVVAPLLESSLPVCYFCVADHFVSVHKVF